MAEIGLVASIFGVASFGTKVATSLYEAADIMIHAHQQIASMAKHVSQFTAILRHLGRVLEAEKGSCSNDLLREIRKIKRSCKSTFREIRATVTSKQFRPFVPVRWLFKKSKAQELEARLDSEQSMLQVMIHTVTVSKLGDMQSRSKEDSKQILGLRDEIDILKTLIIENYNNSIELQHAEQRTEVESQGFPSRGTDNHQGPDPSFGSQEPLSAGPIEIPDLDHTTSRKPSSPVSSLSESDHEDVDPGKIAENARPSTSQGHVDQGHSDSSTDDAHRTDKMQESAVQQMSTYKSAVGSGSYRVSTSLLQMVPYRPNVAYSTQWNRSISAGPDTVQRSAMEEATRSVRLLLDKWTTSGSAPVSELLAETESKEPPILENTQGNRQRELKSSLPQSPPRLPSFTNEYSDDGFDNVYYQTPHDGRPGMREGFMPPPGLWPIPPNKAWTSPKEQSYVRSKDVWKDSPSHDQVPARYVGDDILKVLRYTRGGIVYSKSNDFQHSHYVDSYEIYRLYLVPSFLIPSNESEVQNTELGKGWVLREALDLLGYSYSETASGHFSIPRDLALAEIEELVVYSYQANNRRLAERSRQIVKERGWHKRIAALNHQLPDMDPGVYPGFREPWSQPNAINAYYSGPGVYHQSGRRDHDRASTREPWSQPNAANAYYPRPVVIRQSGRRDYSRASTSDGEIQIVGLPREPGDANPESRPNETEGARETKPAVSEVRFTVPRLDPPRQTAGVPQSRKPASKISEGEAQRKSQDQEIREAMDKLERLKSNRDEAERTKNYSLKSDLEYYAIPDLESRIKKLKQAHKGDKSDGKGALDEKQGRVRLTAVETDSEGSEGPSPKAVDVSDSENGSAAHDLYE